jgi:hypothetical protein
VMVNPGAFLSRRSASCKSVISFPLIVFGAGADRTRSWSRFNYE